MDRKELETWIVRMGEKYPDRVGEVHGGQGCPGADKHCLVGQILHDAGRCDGADGYFDEHFHDDAACALQRKAIDLNDIHTPWGRIPILLGLVPGEQPAECDVTLIKETADAAV